MVKWYCGSFLVLVIIGLYGFSEVKEVTFPTNKADLGKRLFFDPILSSNNQISCSSCHRPEFAFADTVPFSKGVYGRLGKRNTPSSMNMANRTILFFDGRANTLEEQAVFPIQDHNEMDMSIDQAVKKIQQDKEYQAFFKSIYHQKPSKENVLDAIATFERTLETTSKFDLYIAGDSTVFSDKEKRGYDLFMSDRTHCFDCHFTPDFTADEFKNIGLFNGAKLNDSGRYLISKNPKDIGAFKVPGLRNVSVTSPYMHNGQFKTIKEVLSYYNNIYAVVSHPINVDSTMIKPLGLNSQELNDLEAFLFTLTDKRFLKNTKKN